MKKYLSKKLNLRLLWVLPAPIKEANEKDGFFSSIEQERKEKVLREGSVLNKISMGIRNTKIGKRIIKLIKRF